MHWLHPWTALLAGPTCAGKSVFIRDFLHNLHHFTDTDFERIILYYGAWQESYKDLPKLVEFREGVPELCDLEELSRSGSRPKLMILDDLMSEASGKHLTSIFTKGSHHGNLSVFFVAQNLFHSGMREISLNSSYIVVFKNPRDKAQINYLARQICPENPRFIQEIYQDATAKPFGYLLLDLKQSTPENCRFRTNIFPRDVFEIVYVPLKQKQGGRQQKQSILVPTVHV